jgi:hypothetical protein
MQRTDMFLGIFLSTFETLSSFVLKQVPKKFLRFVGALGRLNNFSLVGLRVDKILAAPQRNRTQSKVTRY